MPHYKGRGSSDGAIKVFGEIIRCPHIEHYPLVIVMDINSMSPLKPTTAWKSGSYGRHRNKSLISWLWIYSDPNCQGSVAFEFILNRRLLMAWLIIQPRFALQLKESFHIVLTVISDLRDNRFSYMGYMSDFYLQINSMIYLWQLTHFLNSFGDLADYSSWLKKDFHFSNSKHFLLKNKYVLKAWNRLSRDRIVQWLLLFMQSNYFISERYHTYYLFVINNKVMDSQKCFKGPTTRRNRGY